VWYNARMSKTIVMRGTIRDSDRKWSSEPARQFDVSIEIADDLMADPDTLAGLLYDTARRLAEKMVVAAGVSPNDG
jgi:hypothetical protein